MSLPSSFQTKTKKMKEEDDGVFLFSSKKKTHTHRKKNLKEEKNAKKGVNLPFLWDEALFLPSPLHVPSTLNSPLSSSLVFHVSSKLYAT